MPSYREDFRTLLEQLAQVLTGVPAWTLRLVYPRALAHAYESFQRVVQEEWEMPLQPHTIDELNWYFEQRRSVPPGRFPYPADTRFERPAIAFDGPRFARLYRRWLRRGAAALGEAVSPAISSALTSDSGRVESLILGHAYEHLSPVIDTRGNIAVWMRYRMIDSVSVAAPFGRPHGMRSPRSDSNARTSTDANMMLNVSV